MTLYTLTQLVAMENTPVADFDGGIEALARSIQADTAAWNMTVESAISDLCEVTSKRFAGRGGSEGDEGDFGNGRSDEFAAPMTAAELPAGAVMFPCYPHEYPVAWTQEFMETATIAELSIKQQNAQKRDLRNIMRALQRAIYLSSNRTERDYFDKSKAVLQIKSFLNGDGDAIPMSADSLEYFNGAKHTHYFTAKTANALTEGDIDRGVAHVAEHGYGEQVVIYISLGDEAAIKALAPKFQAYLPVTLAHSIAETRPQQLMTPGQLNMRNRAIGLWDGKAEVRIKPWCVSKRIFFSDIGHDNKPLAFRRRDRPNLHGLRLMTIIPSHPLYVEKMRHDFGIAVNTRENGAVLDWSKGEDADYGDPALR